MSRGRRALARIATLAIGTAAALWLAGTLGLRCREPQALDTAAREAPGRFLDLGGHRAHVLERGAGPPLVLIHGFGASTFDWEEHALAPLAARHRAIAIDLWGHGYSERRGDVRLDFETFADEVAAALDALSIEHAILAAHSMGGAVAATLAARRPERIVGLVLVGGLVPQRLSETPPLFALLSLPGAGELALATSANLAHPGASAAYRERMAVVSRIAGTRAALLRYVRAPDKMRALEDAWRRVRAPALFVHGERDPIVRLAEVERVAAGAADRGLVVLPGLGHWLLSEAPERVVAEIEAFTAAGP
jgi:pimeloyl-ACP methyl ester carboxylesterase